MRLLTPRLSPVATAAEPAVRAGRAALVAFGVYTVLLPPALLVPALAGADPFTLRGTLFPLAVGFMLAVPLLAVALMWRRPAVYDVAAAAFAAWTALAMRVALHGTPFGFDGLSGDMARMASMATRFSVVAASSDGIVEGVAAEYPPLYPWLIGRAAALTGIPAWHLLAEAEIVWTSAAVVAAYALWRRTTTAPVALALAVFSLVAFSYPWKAYEVFALAVFIPWALGTLAARPGGRMHWLGSGLLLGLIVQLYLGFFLYGIAGLLALVVCAFWQSADRWGLLWYFTRVVAIGLAVSAWYVAPYLVTLATTGGQNVADLYATPAVAASSFPFMQPSFLGAVEAAGLVGAVVLRNRTWWGLPMALLIAGTYAYQGAYAVGFVFTGHTGMAHHSMHLLHGLLLASGVLSLTWLVPKLPVKPWAQVALAVCVVWSGSHLWRAWSPVPVGSAVASHAEGVHAARAHAEPLPDGRMPATGAAGQEELRQLGTAPPSAFPVAEIRRAVREHYGPHVRPRTLAVDERLYSYLPWPGYLPVVRTAALSVVRWDDRYAELQRLAAITDPERFAAATRASRFGGIDVFVLWARKAAWTWRPVLADGSTAQFSPVQFSPRHFAVVRDLPGGIVVAIRLPDRQVSARSEPGPCRGAACAALDAHAS
ncbi:arabinofuranosyltransferase [Nonomuraea sp. NPDC050540]|uniref:arabinofuranosyltransferase n=1 Tax=Nonomuraea sp. NPDC050540 TaxID=3364367 RepID=UPI0037B08EAE